MRIKQWLLFIGILKCFNLPAQYRVGVSYILSDITSNNIGVFGQYQLSQRHHLGFGIKYHFNDDTTKPIFRYYYRNLYSSKISNRFGFIFDYKYYILKKQFIIKPYLFYNLQYIKSGAKAKNNLVDFVTGTISDRPITYDPINFFENHIGLGVDIQLNAKLFSFIGISGGGTFMTDIKTVKDLNAGITTQAFGFSKTSEFSWLFNTGITYSVGKEKKKRKK